MCSKTIFLIDQRRGEKSGALYRAFIVEETQQLPHPEKQWKFHHIVQLEFSRSRYSYTYIAKNVLLYPKSSLITLFLPVDFLAITPNNYFAFIFV